ncbi:MAG: hemolysin family protein [Planctomycetota bacterium]|nr:hemolysin family protein [Planctomycetota bacterium]
MPWFLASIAEWWASLGDYLAVDPALVRDPWMIGRIVLQFVLLLGSGFFSGSETALFSLSRLDLQKLRRERHRHSESIHELLDQPRRLIISILCGNEIAVTAAIVNLTGILVTLYGTEKAGVLSILVMSPLLLLLGEVTPKTIAVSNPARISANLIAGPLSHWVRLISPLRWAIRGASDRITTMLVGDRTDAENILRVDEFRSLVEEVAKEGQLNATERVLIHNLLDAGDAEVIEIMTPRTQMFFISDTTSVPEALDRFRAGRHSRVPIFTGNRDNLVGFIHAEDVVRIVMDDMDLRLLSIDDLVPPPVVVPPTKKVDEMFDYFQDHNCRAAVVMNEFGGVAGFVTITDVLNSIFGPISGSVVGEDLHSETDQEIYEVPGDMKLTDFENLTHFGIDDPRMTTIGGVAFRHVDRLPKTRDTVLIEDLQITVLEMDAHRIARVRVERVTSHDMEESADESNTEPPEEPVVISVPTAPPVDGTILDVNESEENSVKAEDEEPVVV